MLNTRPESKPHLPGGLWIRAFMFLSALMAGGCILALEDEDAMSLENLGGANEIPSVYRRAADRATPASGSGIAVTDEDVIGYAKDVIRELGEDRFKELNEKVKKLAESQKLSDAGLALFRQAFRAKHGEDKPGLKEIGLVEGEDRFNIPSILRRASLRNKLCQKENLPGTNCPDNITDTDIFGYADDLVRRLRKSFTHFPYLEASRERRQLFLEAVLMVQSHNFCEESAGGTACIQEGKLSKNGVNLYFSTLAAKHLAGLAGIPTGGNADFNAIKNQLMKSDYADPISLAEGEEQKLSFVGIRYSFEPDHNIAQTITYREENGNVLIKGKKTDKKAFWVLVGEAGARLLEVTVSSNIDAAG